MSDVKLGKQRFEIDWDTGESVDLDPYIRRLLEKNAELERRLSGKETWYEYVPLHGPFSVVSSGSGEFDPSPFLATLGGQRVQKVRCRVERVNVS